MGKNIDFTLVLACYNESQTFKESMNQIVSILEDSLLKYEIIFVEDKSADNTAKLVKQACKKNPNKFRAIYHLKNCGRGKTVADGIKAAKGNVVGYIDFDCEVSPVYIPQAVKLIAKKQADIVVGKRIYKTSIKGLFRELLSVGYMVIIRRFLETGGVDTESGYKFFNRKKIVPLLKYADHPHWFWDTQIVILAKMAGLKVAELPVLFLRNSHKTSTVKIFRDSYDYLINVIRFSTKISNGDFDVIKNLYN